MSLDISDPHISMAFDALTHNDPLRWFLLAYGDKSNQLSLCASGTGDLEELRAHITPGNVHYGVFREQTNHAPVCISLAVIPDSVGGVRRARALVHARAVSSKFKTHQALNASNPEQITRESLLTLLQPPPSGAAATNANPALAPALPTNIDIGLTPPLPHINSTLSPPMHNHSASLAPGPSPSTSNKSPSQVQSRRKPPPRLSMFPTARPSPSGIEHPSTPPKEPEQSPLATSPRIPQIPVASSPELQLTSSSTMPQSNRDAEVSPPSPTELASTIITDNSFSGDLHAKRSWLAKRDAPLPSPPHSDPESETDAAPRSRGFTAFDSDNESGSDHSIQMHGPLAEVGKLDPTPAPASPIGSIPDALSISSGSSRRDPSSAPLHKPLSAPLDKSRSTVDNTTNGTTSPNDASIQPTPAQVEASRARRAWEAKERAGVPNADESISPPTKQRRTPSPRPKDTEAPRAQSGPAVQQRRMVPAYVTDDSEPPPVRPVAVTDAVPPAARATKEVSAVPFKTQDTHRRAASQDAYTPPTPPQTRTRFLERASPETQVEGRQLALLEEERRRRTAERAKREREERAKDEERERAITEHKEREHAKRVELARQAEVRREEQRKRDAEEHAEREAREAREKEARLAREKEAAARVRHHAEKNGSGMELLSGFVTLETASVWRRRYFRLSTESWQFFRNDKDVAQPLHVIELAHVRALREWNEGYDELEAIPHSFAIELADNEAWQCFADSAEDKEILLGLLNQAAGL